MSEMNWRPAPAKKGARRETCWMAYPAREGLTRVSALQLSSCARPGFVRGRDDERTTTPRRVAYQGGVASKILGSLAA